MSANRMRIENGIVSISDGVVEGIEFANCDVILGLNVKLSDCTFDSDCAISSAGFASG